MLALIISLLINVPLVLFLNRNKWFIHPVTLMCSVVYGINDSICEATRNKSNSLHLNVLQDSPRRLGLYVVFLVEAHDDEKQQLAHDTEEQRQGARRD